MPPNRNAHLRYQVIDKCLRNRSRKWTWLDILHEVNIALKEDRAGDRGIGKTQFFEDLKDIEYRVYKSEIERTKEGKSVYLRYADPKYSISNHPLTENEANQLKSAISVLTRFSGTPQSDWVNEIIPLVESKLGLVKTETEVVSFESNQEYVGSIHLLPLFNAIVNKRVLRIGYQDFKSSEPYTLEIHPYYLKQYNSRWFLFGYNRERENPIQNLALDRIKSVQEVKGKYISTKIDWNDYFFDIVGVTKLDQPVVEVKLLILDAEQAAYIQTKPLHHTQKQIRKVEGGFETSIRVVPNFELEKLILSFGERIKVTSPKGFKERIIRKLHQAFLLYN